jgi:hypothetical protein
MFSILKNVGLKSKLPKFEFGANNLQYLRFRLMGEGTLPEVDKLKYVKKLRQFTNLCNFSGRHIKIFEKVAAPLYQLQSNKSKFKKGPMPEKAIEAFDNCPV